VSRVAEVRPDPVEVLRRIAADARRRALFRAYLGYAPGCGTTSAMLDEARRRAGRRTDVLAAAWHLHEEPAPVLAGLSVLGGLRGAGRNQALDVEAALARNPEVVCIDDLAGPDTNGRPRYESVARFLSAGITVLATLHVLSLRSAAEALVPMLGPPAGVLLDDEVVQLIDELEIVDVPPSDLVVRIREHQVLTPAQLARAMQRELRPAVLEVLRETSLRTIAELADRDLAAYLPATASPLEFRGRVVLCLPIRPGLEERIRAAARYAATQDAKFGVVTVRTRDLSEAEKELVGSYAALAYRLRGEFVRLDGRQVAPALAAYIRDSKATEVILGHRRRTRWRPWDKTSELIRRLAGVDVHILRAGAYDAAGTR
jgi:two-component system sensor histidine kinase KdpD